MKFIRHVWFTLTELVIAISISALVLIVIFNFVADTVSQLADTNKNTRFLSDFSRFTSRLNTYANTFLSGSILIDQPENVGHDVLVFYNPEQTSWVLWWVVDAWNYKLLDNNKIDTYQDAVVWYRLLSDSELTALLADTTLAYGYDFFGDKTFDDFKIHEFQAEYYNNQDIMSLDMSAVKSFDIEKVGIAWQELPRDDLFEVNLNF